jgi:phage terminase large subunit-like protein
MGEALDRGALERWRREPALFIHDVIRNPETSQPFELLPAEIAFLERAFKLDDAGRMLYPELLYSCPKKSGKTGFGAMLTLTGTLVYGGAYAEGYCIANDYEQAQGRVFQAIRRIVEASPLLRREAKITVNRIEFGATGATITAIANDYAGAAGANPSISTFDETWAGISERFRRLWDEMVPPPTRKIACRLTTSYAGFTGESSLLNELYNRGLSQPVIGKDLHAGNGVLMFWSHDPIAPWQTPEWIEQMRGQLRPNAFLRLIENRWVTAESSFVDMAWWDQCVDPAARPIVADKALPVWIGLDASLKRDQTAVVAVTWDQSSKQVRLVWHRVFQPSAADNLDFEATIERTLLDLRGRFAVRAVRYDPWQMAAVAQRLTRAGLPMREYPQSVPNLTMAGNNLYELIKSQGLVAYADDDIRLAVSRAIAIETPRGFRIAKEKTSHKIDVVVALAMASMAAVEQGQWVSDEVPIIGGGVFSTPIPTAQLNSGSVRKTQPR